MRKLVHAFWKDDSGAAAIEYALIAALIALAIVGGATALGGDISALFSKIGTYLSGVKVG